MPKQFAKETRKIIGARIATTILRNLFCCMKDNSLIEFLKIESFLENYARFFFFKE
ncbi:hypothetical protein LEP1GSC123_3980 [Leptospira borgpetersenii str. 200701203]|uniref:Uncharacterized protein n=1 Tax=Leptospira borgpetersenii str. 200701203 TaxID=1193007 RepID=M3HUA4_LEPBO|nr:hypothetical protein LEP1GSC123_3980 [Leptospira borgpetersenii str. 200701203]